MGIIADLSIKEKWGQVSEGSEGTEGSEGPLRAETVAMLPVTIRFMGSKVHRFGLVPFTVIPTDRFNKILRVLKVLRFLV